MRVTHKALQKITQRINSLRFFSGDGPLPAPVILKQNRVYILPTRAGLVFSLLVFLMLLASVNYSNSLGFLLTFILASLLVVSILHTYRNLYKLSVDLGRIPATFAGARFILPVRLDNRQHAARYAIGLQNSENEVSYCDIASDSLQTVKLQQNADKRGWQPTSRITLETRFPLGLFRAWALVQIDRKHLVYPMPESQYRPMNNHQNTADSVGGNASDGDDFSGLPPYRIGDSLRHVHWKLAAQGRGLHTKQFSGSQSEEVWLDWRTIADLDAEPRLCRLTRWVIEAEKRGQEYGLWIPGCVIKPDRGERHQHLCLKALALYGHIETDFTASETNVPESSHALA